MKESLDLVIVGARLADASKAGRADIGVRGGKIAAIGDLTRRAARQRFDARGLHVLPGVIDTQVHFREPGKKSVEDLASGSRAAVMGGVTAVFEMPNTLPPTTSAAALKDKLKRAKGRMFCNYAFYAGGVAENARLLPRLERMAGCCGVKVFMGSSTGTLLASEDEEIAAILSGLQRRAAFHSEDEPRLKERRHLARAGKPESHALWRDAESAANATRRLLRIAARLGKKIHVLHVTTAAEAGLLAANKAIASMEVTPQHLTLAAPECYERLGTLAQMNPPIRRRRHRRALWEALRKGVVDVIGSDHAPHALEAKRKTYPQSPSGMTGVQTLVPIMLDHVNKGRLTLKHLSALTCANPARLFGVRGKGRLAEGFDADLTIVDMKARRVIENSWIESRCGWTPFAGKRVSGWVRASVIGGRIVMREGEIKEPARGRALSFTHS